MKWLQVNNDDKDDDDDASSKNVEVAEIGTGEALIMLYRLVNLRKLTIKGRKKLSCPHERQIKEDKSAEQKSKPYQCLFYVRIKFI